MLIIVPDERNVECDSLLTSTSHITQTCRVLREMKIIKMIVIMAMMWMILIIIMAQSSKLVTDLQKEMKIIMTIH